MQGSLMYYFDQNSEDKLALVDLLLVYFKSGVKRIRDLLQFSTKTFVHEHVKRLSSMWCQNV